jgi:hypothetical protein
MGGEWVAGQWCQPNLKFEKGGQKQAMEAERKPSSTGVGG